MFSKDSLETLKQRIDIVEVISSHIDLKRAGAAYKALCPFHDEKSPSFVLQKGDPHYHCFGCGAHGDAIQFLMAHLKMSFLEAVESLAQKFHVHLERVDSNEKKGPNKTFLKEALAHASHFFQFMLLHTPEGHQALKYLYGRGLDLDFIQKFQVGFAPAASGMLRRVLHEKSVKDEIMVAAGLIQTRDSGGYRDFFSDRITFPICDASGAVIGFSARKYKEETFGGKYINTPETPLFKKSRVLFGLNYSRRRIAKEQKAIIVEGQIDALRLIHAGFNYTVAGQGTAFGEGHAKELIALGVSRVFLALDGDTAGQEATRKIGHLFQKDGVEVRVVLLPSGMDPDAFLRRQGSEAFEKLLDESVDYITFLVRHQSAHYHVDTPAGKNKLVDEISTQIRSWTQPVMVHESLRRLAHLLKVPEDMLGIGQDYLPNIHIKQRGLAGLQTVDPDRIMESDLLCWLLMPNDIRLPLLSIAERNLKAEDLRLQVSRRIYTTIQGNQAEERPCDLLSLAIDLDDPEGQLFISEISNKRVNRDRAEEHFLAAVQKILDRNWMEQREAIRRKIQSGQCTDDEALELAKQFDALKRSPPVIRKG